MAELPHIGKHCAVCNQLDYLPITCFHCNGVFCKDHATAITHKCTPDIELQKVDLKKRDKPNPGDYAKCAFCSTTVSILETITCFLCRGRFCLQHRHQVDHQCSQLASKGSVSEEEALQQQRRKAEVEAILKKLQGSSGIAVKNRGKKNDALAQRVAAMKLKSTATGQASIPEEERLHFFISFVPNEPLSFDQMEKAFKDKPIFLCREWTIGRCVDWIANNFSLVNRNNEAKAAKLVFLKLLPQEDSATESAVHCCTKSSSTDQLHLCFSHELKELETTKILANTDKLLVTYLDL